MFELPPNEASQDTFWYHIRFHHKNSHHAGFLGAHLGDIVPHPMVLEDIQPLFQLVMAAAVEVYLQGAHPTVCMDAVKGVLLELHLGIRQEMMVEVYHQVGHQLIRQKDVVVDLQGAPPTVCLSVVEGVLLGFHLVISQEVVVEDYRQVDRLIIRQEVGEMK